MSKLGDLIRSIRSSAITQAIKGVLTPLRLILPESGQAVVTLLLAFLDGIVAASGTTDLKDKLVASVDQHKGLA